MKPKFENILLIAGSGQNVGKTTFACLLIQNVQNQKPIAVKITPHFHNITPGLIEIAEGKNWKLFEETDKTTNKDSSLYLQNLAQKSYLIQTNDIGLQEAFSALEKLLPKNRPVIIESAALINFIEPGLFIVLLPDGKCQKEKMEQILYKANLIVISDGSKFYPHPDKITFNKSWQIE